MIATGVLFKWAAPLFARSAERWDHDDAVALARLLEPFVPAAGRVLDVGGGTGRLANLIGQTIGCSVTVLDSSPQMLRYAAGLPGVETMLGDCAALPFEDASFDAVIVVDAFHHFRRPHEAVREMARVLRHGGGVLVADLDRRRADVRWTAVLERAVGEPGAFLAPREIEAIFAAAGIEGTCHERSGSSYGFVGRRP